MSSSIDGGDGAGPAASPVADPRSRVLRSLRERDLWLAAIAADANLTDFAARVATALSRHFNFERDDPSAWPSVAFIAGASAGTERGVQKALTALIAAGYLARDLGGQGAGKTSRYSPMLPAAQAEPRFGVEIDPTPNSGSPYEGSTPNSRSPKNAGSRVNHGSLEGEPPFTQISKEEEGQAPARGLAHTSDSYAFARDVGPTGVGSASPPAVGAGTDFGAFLSVYPTKGAAWSPGLVEDARTAFEAAVASGADPAAIVAGAERYARKRANEIAVKGADNVRFTRRPSVWLTERDWEKASRRKDGKSVASRPNGGRPKSGCSPTIDEIIDNWPARLTEGKSREFLVARAKAVLSTHIGD